MPASKVYAVMRTYADGTGGWGKQWQASKSRTLDYQAAIATPHGSVSGRVTRSSGGRSTPPASPDHGPAECFT
jgi:hypothetical protein